MINYLFRVHDVDIHTEHGARLDFKRLDSSHSRPVNKYKFIVFICGSEIIAETNHTVF